MSEIILHPDDVPADLAEYFEIVDPQEKSSVWKISTSPYPGAHYATFPEALVETCLLAGTSPQACEVCGAPWRRVVERGEPVKRPDSGGVVRRLASGDAGQGQSNFTQATLGRVPSVTTLGWSSSCTCPNVGAARCVVLDPFYGSGTTARVATKHGRDCIGIELNDTYESQSDARTNNVQISMESWLV